MAEVKILDHGYVKFIESWGSDERIIESARMSTQKGFRGWGPLQCDCVWNSTLPGSPLLSDCADPTCKHCKGTGLKPGDEKLLRYLYEHKHSTPFEFAGFTLEIQCPILVIREWHRHRTQSYSEMSARYEPIPDFNYVPTLDRLMMNAGGSNKQAGTMKDAIELTPDVAMLWLDMLQKSYDVAEAAYQFGLANGVPKELARCPMPVGRFTRMRATANLRNWLGFLTLRMDTAAQWEIRQYAHVVGNIVEQLFPRTWELFIS